MSQDPDVTFAKDCVSQTLHGPLPIESSMRLAEAVIRLSRELESTDPNTHKDRVKLNPDRSEYADELARGFVVTLCLWTPPHVGLGAGAGGDSISEATERALTRLTGLL